MTESPGSGAGVLALWLRDLERATLPLCASLCSSLQGDNKNTCCLWLQHVSCHGAVLFSYLRALGRVG